MDGAILVERPNAIYFQNGDVQIPLLKLGSRNSPWVKNLVLLIQGNGVHLSKSQVGRIRDLLKEIEKSYGVNFYLSVGSKGDLSFLNFTAVETGPGQ